MKVREYIKKNWTVFKDASGYIPYPYVPPCFKEGAFNILYYWDTFFTNEGLIADGRIEDARNNVNNLIYFLNLFGCVPNMTSETGADYASQPPLLYMMVNRLMTVAPDPTWEKTAIKALEKEYRFWMNERISICGLNRYGTNMEDEEKLIRAYDNACKRIDLPQNLSNEEKIKAEKSLIAEGESGEDHTPRFYHRAYEYAAVDLNSHLYGLEDFLENYFCDKDKGKTEYYQTAKLQRAKLMEKYMRDEDGVYHDYRFTDGVRSEVYACACFTAYSVGLAKNGIEVLVKKLATDYGFSACENLGVDGCQWGYPYVWAPHQYFAFQALNRVGQTKIANEYANRFLKIIEDTYEKTGFLWERYEKNGVAKSIEYPTQIMLGWTAGVYNIFYDKLKG